MSEIAGELRGPDGERIAWRRVQGFGPTIVWLGGFASDMTGTKAETLAQWAMARGRDYLRFDYSGHGASGGDFKDGTITRWRADALQVLDELVQGPAVLVGSSMGGWIACLLAMARRDRIAGLVLIAPAADFTQALIWPNLTPAQQRQIQIEGVWTLPSPYEGQGVPITRALIEDGARWSILGAPIPIHCPVRVLQGGEDPDVPWRHALSLAHGIESADVVFSLIKDGDHRLSRPRDLERIVAAVAEVAVAANNG